MSRPRDTHSPRYDPTANSALNALVTDEEVQLLARALVRLALDGATAAPRPAPTSLASRIALRRAHWMLVDDHMLTCEAACLALSAATGVTPAAVWDIANPIHATN